MLNLKATLYCKEKEDYSQLKIQVIESSVIAENLKACFSLKHRRFKYLKRQKKNRQIQMHYQWLDNWQLIFDQPTQTTVSTVAFIKILPGSNTVPELQCLLKD